MHMRRRPGGEARAIEVASLALIFGLAPECPITAPRAALPYRLQRPGRSRLALPACASMQGAAGSALLMRHQRLGELAPRGDRELAVGVMEVHLNGLYRQEQH